MKYNEAQEGVKFAFANEKTRALTPALNRKKGGFVEGLGNARGSTSRVLTVKFYPGVKAVRKLRH